MNNEKTVHEPLFHIIKRGPIKWWKVFEIRAIAVVAAVLVSAIFSYATIGSGIGGFFSSLFSTSFGTYNLFWNFLLNIAKLLCISIALAPAFKMKFWNIGADGQALIGCVAAYICKRLLANSMPSIVVMILCLVSAIVAGIIWAVIPAIFKAKWNTNETLFTLMMNYIAVQIVAYMVVVWAKGTSLPVYKQGNLEQFHQYLITVLIVTAITIFMYIYLKRTKHGYELSMVGESQNTARYAGIGIKKVIIRTMVLSGAICGLTGFIILCGQNRMVGLTTEVVGGIGFTAIIVTWLAKCNPAYMALTATFVVFIQSGANNLYPSQSAFGQIIVAIFFFFVIGCEFFIRYQIKFRHKKTQSENEVK